MKKISSICCLILVLALSANGQEVDTTKNLSTKNKIFASDSSSSAIYEFAKNSPFYIKTLMPQTYSKITLGYLRDQGKFMLAQDADRLEKAYLKTEGSAQLKSVSLWGMFSYQKVFEDSTQYNHQTRNNPSSPYYFGSPIRVSYERAIYSLKAMAEKNLLGSNLPIGMGADYRVGSHFSTNDPRGSVSDYQFNLVGTIGYRLFEKLKIGAAYRYGYGQETFNVAYKNNSYSQNTLLPQYNNYLISGYGEAYVKNGERNYDDNQKRDGFDTYLDFSTDQLGNFVASYSHVQETQQYQRANSEGIFRYNDYKIERDVLSIVWYKDLANKKLVVNLNYTNLNGSDFLHSYVANNYVYNYNQLSIKNNLTVKQSNRIYNYSLSAGRIGEQREDGLTGNDVKYYNFNLTGGFGYQQQTTKASFWGFDVNATYSKPLSGYYNVTAANSGLFTQTVIYHDYLYNTAAKFGGAASINYSMPTFKDVQTELKIGISYLERQKTKIVDQPTALGKDRFSSNISLNLYF